MSTPKPVDFSVDKENSTITVKKECSAEPSFVWNAFTKADILDQWWAPKPWISKTKSMVFEVGGRRLYAMRGPEGEEHWALADFTSIAPISNFQFLDAFCDQEATINTAFARSEWNVDFTDQQGSTLVTMTIKHQSTSDLESILAMGFKEGFELALQGLDQVLAGDM